MGRKKSTALYAGMDVGLSQVHKTIRGNKADMHITGIAVTKIVKKIMGFMKIQSPEVFAKLYDKIFCGGSSYDGLKIGEHGDFDIDVLLKLPQVVKPAIDEDIFPGYAQLELINFRKLESSDPKLFQGMKLFVDNNNYVLTTQLKSTLMQSIFDKAHLKYFPEGIDIDGKNYQITRVQTTGPAFTLTIEKTDFFVQIDLVPCIVLPSSAWPQKGFRANPYRKPSEFYLVPKKSKHEYRYVDRYFRLSFQKQERKRIVNQFWMKPTMRIMKLLRDNFEQQVSSYAIKTLFMWEQERLQMDSNFWKAPCLCLVHMLERFSECLKVGAIWYFWNTTQKLNLLGNLSKEQMTRYRKDVEQVITAIKADPSPQTILNIFELKSKRSIAYIYV